MDFFPSLPGVHIFRFLISVAKYTSKLIGNEIETGSLTYTFFFFSILFYSIVVYFFYCILGFGVHVKNMQDSCIGTHVAV